MAIETVSADNQPRLTPKALLELLLATYGEWSKDNAQTLGAALAFYSTFSVAPLFVIIIAAVGFVLDREEVQVAVLSRLQEVIGTQGAGAVQQMIMTAYPPGLGVIATIISVVIILAGASSAFVMLRQSLNIIWGVQPNPQGYIRKIIKERLLAFVMILVIGSILLLSLLLSAGVAGGGSLIGRLVSIPILFFQIMDFLISISLVTLLFASIYKILPDVEIAWTDVWIGAAITAAFFTLGNLLLGFYLGRSSIRSAYGAAGSLVVLLLWVYYSAQIFLMGAEFTQVYANRYGSRLAPRTRGLPGKLI